MTTLMVYAIEEYNASSSNAGLACGIFVISSLIFRLFTGKFIERIGRRKMIFGGLLLFLFASLLYFMADSFGLLLMVRFIHGAAFGVVTTALATAVVDVIPRERRGEGIGYYTLSNTLSTAIGPFIGVIFVQAADFTMIFVVCTLFSIAGIVVSLFSHIPEAAMTREQQDAMKGYKLADFFEINALRASIMVAIACFCYSGVMSFLAAYSNKIGLLDAASLFFVVYAICLFVSRPITGRLLDAKGENIVIYPALVVFIISLVLISQSYQDITLLLAGVLLGLGYGTVASATQALAVKEALGHRVGLATSTFFIFADLGMGIGPYIQGFIVQAFDYRILYAILAIIVFASIFVYYLLHGKKATARRTARV